jgi:hypothetical protein
MGESRGEEYFACHDVCVFQVRSSVQDKDGKLTNHVEDRSSRLMPMFTRKAISLVQMALTQIIALPPFILAEQQYASVGDTTQQSSLQMVFRILQLVEKYRRVTFSEVIILPEPAVIAR